LQQTFSVGLRAGERFSRISLDLDILDGTLRLWMRQFPIAQLLPVKIEPLSAKSVPDRLKRTELVGAISLQTPGGFRFDGLDVGDVAVLLEHVR
jgi:hypothetical protein